MAIAQDEFRNGSLTAAQDVVELAQPGTATVMVQLTGTFVGTVVFEVNVDQGASPTWGATKAQTVSDGSIVTSATAPGVFRVDVSGAREFRVRCSAYTSGTVVVTMNGSVATASQGLSSSAAGGAAGTEYTEGDTDASITGTAILWEDAADTLAPVSATKPLPVNSELPTAVSLADDIATPTAPMVGAVSYGWDGANFDRTVTFPGAADARNVTNTGLLSQSFGYGFNGTTWDRLRSDTTFGLDADVTRVIPGVTATALGKAEDAGHTTGDTGVAVWAVRQDTQSALATTDLDYIPHTTDNNGSLRVVAAGYTGVFTATLTRPNDTNAYAAGDEISNSTSAPTIITLSNIARFSGGTGVIQGVCATFSDNWATKPSLELWIFDTTSTPSNDNAAFAPSDGVADTCFAIIPLTSTYVGDATATTGNFTMDTGQINVPFQTVGSANLFVRIVIRNAGTPAVVSSTIKLRFRALCD